MQRGSSPFGTPRRRRWGGVSWWYSLVLIVPLLLFTGLIIYQEVDLGGENEIDGTVTDAYTGDPVSGATVTIGDESMETNGSGQFRARLGKYDQLQVSRPGYDSVTTEVSEEDSEIAVELRPNSVSGEVTHRVTEEPIAGVTVEAVRDGSSVATTTTDEDGTYSLEDLPENVTIVFTMDDFATVEEELSERVAIDASMRPSVLTGFISDGDGEPVPHATIGVGDAMDQTGDDGAFRIEEAPESGEVIIKAPGYWAEVIELDDQTEIDVTLRTKPVKALYATASTVGDPERLDELLDLIDRTEANAIVIDAKDSSGLIFYDTQVELAQEIGAVYQAYDIKEVIQKIKERGIYVIARQVVFEDPTLTEAYPELAIDDTEGGAWETWNGIVWADAYEEDVWNYNIDIMLELAELGVDEVQLDYIRFPSDGPLNRADYGDIESTSETRRAAISEFLSRAHEALAPTPVYLAGDIFGLTLWETGDGGIGQNLESVTEHLDYINPMIYPSHFFPGSMGFDIPNDHPYEVIYQSLENGLERIPNSHNKIRPWLQDFSYGEGISYGDEEVRAQIDATNDFGATGWMLWSASNEYHEGALEPAE